jgi:hypothetical protein
VEKSPAECGRAALREFDLLRGRRTPYLLAALELRVCNSPLARCLLQRCGRRLPPPPATHSYLRGGGAGLIPGTC